MCVGQKIKQYIDERGIKQAFISSKTSISTNKLCLLLMGEQKMLLDDYVSICGVLKVPLDTFLEPKKPE